MINHPCSMSLLAAALLLGSPASAQSPNRAQLQAEVSAVLEEYVGAFSQRRADFVADSTYAAPAYFLGGDRARVEMTTAQVEARFERRLSSLVAEGYQRSEIRTSNVCVLSDVGALASIRFVRYRTDGSVMLESAATYLFAKMPEGWRIVANIGHPADRIIDCSD